MTARRARGLWAAVAVAVAALSLTLAQAGVAASALLASLVVGVAVAYRLPGQIAVRRPAATGAHVVIGSVLGLQVGEGSVAVIGNAWPALALATLATLALGLLLGASLERRGHMDAVTATLAMVPGGAIGLVTMARDLDGDDRLVAFSQYYRVLAILIATPLVAATVLPRADVGGAPAGDAAAAGVVPLLCVAALALAGWSAARLARAPTPSLLGPLLACGTAGLLFPELDLYLPAALRELAFALVGLDVGLRFTRASLAHARSVLPALTWTLLALLLGCLTLAIALASTTSMELLDCYLATTPGGLSVVAATAYGTGADLSLVVAAQTVRMVAMMLLAPFAVRLMLRVLQRAPDAVPRA